MAHISHLWMFFGAMMSSNAVDLRRSCTDVSLNASVKSEVFLPCHFNISFDNETVIWRHYGDPLLSITTNGSIYFASPRKGRVNVFPLLFKKGIFSVHIHDLESLDFGTYVCELNNECWRVHFKESTHPFQQELPKTEKLKSWLFFFAGAGLFTLLFIIFNRNGLKTRLLSWTNVCASKCSCANEENHEERDSSSQTSHIQKQDPNDPTTSTVYHVVQARSYEGGDADNSGGNKSRFCITD